MFNFRALCGTNIRKPKPLLTKFHVLCEREVYEYTADFGYVGFLRVKNARRYAKCRRIL